MADQVGEAEATPIVADCPAAAAAAEGGERPASGASNKKLLLEQFTAFAKFGDSKNDRNTAISLSQSDKWMKQAKVIDGKKITATDTGIYFKKLKLLKLSFADYQTFLKELSKAKNVPLEEIHQKLIQCGSPGTSGTTIPKDGAAGRPISAAKTAAVDRLTDSSKYTGSHKLRFDESGRGRGIEGRKEQVNGSGYVQGYANKNTYDKSH